MRDSDLPIPRNLEFTTITGTCYRVELYLDIDKNVSGYSVDRHAKGKRIPLPHCLYASPESFEKLRGEFLRLKNSPELSEEALIKLIRISKPRTFDSLKSLVRDLEKGNSPKIENFRFAFLDYTGECDIHKSSYVEKVRDLNDISEEDDDDSKRIFPARIH